MATTYIPSNLPAEYDVTVLQEEFNKLLNAFQELQSSMLILDVWNEAPPRTFDGMMVRADGTNWNPGAGEGVYVYYNSTWNKL